MATAGSKRTTTPRSREKIIDLTDDLADLVKNAPITAVAGTIKLGDDKFRVLKGSNAFRVLGLATGDLDEIKAAFEVFIHEDDRAAFREWLDSRHNMDPDQMNTLLTRIYEVNAGRPTTPPSE